MLTAILLLNKAQDMDGYLHLVHDDNNVLNHGLELNALENLDNFKAAITEDELLDFLIQRTSEL